MENFWEKRHWENEDRHLLALKNASFQRQFQQIKWKHGLYTIRGPRQIGKTSWAKKILSENASSKKCFYLSCENIRDHIDLAELFKSLVHYQMIILDEITFVSEWSRAIKHELDANDRRTIILTGSNMIDLRQGTDLMPGRWGEGQELFLLPMEFDEFSLMRKNAGWKDLETVEELQLYFKVGGFPLALAESGPNGKKIPKAIETYKKWLVGDLKKKNKNETYLKELLYQIAKTQGSTLSLQTLAQKTNIGSHHTALDYVNLLEDCFAVKMIYAIDPSTNDFQFRRQKKIYFRDPLLYWLAFDWAEQEPPENAFEQIAEIVANEYLNRRFGRYGYAENRKGEVDFYSPNHWAVEVKWVPIVKNLSQLYRDMRAPQKIIWSQTNFLKDLREK